ncbi:MAG: PD-(D/E)XK nuclease family protein [Synergistaceae bacterium]|jgi:RecB family exonuclease|nr:PD-(D/E)XK nuclease family protein [Synergistaceae bacterium]
MIKLFSYVKLSALTAAIRAKQAREAGDGVVYMLPSMSCEENLLDMLRSEGSYFGSRPDIWSWQELYNRIVPITKRRRCIDPPDHNLALKFVTDRTAADFEARGIQTPAGIGMRGFINVLGDATREMLLEGVEPDLLLPPDAVDGPPSPDELLYRLYTDYLMYLEDNGLADNSDIPSLARRAMSDALPTSIKDRKMRWVGFMSFTGSQLKLIQALDALGADMEFYMPDSGGVDFRNAAVQLGADHAPLASEPCVIRRVSSRDVYAQFENISDMIVREYAGLNIGILANGDHKELMAHALAKRGIPWQSRSEVTVDKTSLMDIAVRTWEAHKLGWPPTRVRYILGSAPFGIGLDLEKFIRFMPEGIDMWKEFFSGDESALETIISMESFCRLLEREDGCTCEDLLRGLEELSGAGKWENRLAAISGDDADMDSAIREIASSRLEIEHKISMMEDVNPALGEAASVRFAGEGAMGFLLSWAGEAAVALSPLYRGAVCLYESPPSVLVSHDVWIMTDVDGTRYPGQSSDQALLGEELRTRVNGSPDDFVHLPTMHEKRQQKEAMFHRLMAVGEQVSILSRCEFDAGGNPIGDSPFVSRARLRNSPYWKIGDEEPLAAEISVPHPRYRGRYPRTSRFQPGTEKMRISLSHADEFLDCPFSYWCSRIARLDPSPEPAGIMDRMSLGNFMHDMWQMAVTSYSQGGRTLRSILESEWNQASEDLAAKYPLVADSRARAVVSDLRARMIGIADMEDEADARAYAGGMARSRIETEMKLPAIEFDHVTFTGRADRVDFWTSPAGDAAVIFDYKLGGSSSYTKSFQLASYAETLRSSGVFIAGFCYLCHGDGKMSGSWSEEFKPVYAKSSRGSSCEEKMDMALEGLRDMEKIVDGGIYEAKYDSPRCGYCGYATICRRAERCGDYARNGDDSDDDE